MLLASSGAHAADAVYFQDTTPAAVPAAYNWSGFYVGIGGGTVKHPVDSAGTNLLAGSLNVNGNGFVGVLRLAKMSTTVPSSGALS